MKSPRKGVIKSPYNRGSRLEKSISVLETVTTMVPIAHKKALTQALYTAGTIATFLIFGIISYYTYDVLKVFIKPLLWALLCGSFLFPVKYRLHKYTELHLKRFQEENKSMITEVICSPFYALFSYSELIGSNFINHYQMILFSFSILAVVKILYHFELISNFFGVLFFCSTYFYTAIYYLNYILSQQTIIFTITLGLIILLIVTRSVALKQPIAISIWCCLLSSVFYVIPGFKVFIVCVISLLFLLGIYPSKPKKPNARPSNTSDYAAINPFQELIYYISSKNKYFKVLCFLFVFTIVLQDISYVLLILIPLFIFGLKKVVYHEYTSNCMNLITNYVFDKSFTTLKNKLFLALDEFKSNFIPPFMIWFVLKIKNGDRRLNKLVIASLPSISSAIIILMLFTLTVFCFMVLLVKIQHEGVYAVQLTSEVIDKSVSLHPELKNLLPTDPAIPQAVSSFVGTGFTQVREYLSSSLETADEKLKKEILDVWDKMYFEYNQYFVTNKSKYSFQEHYTKTDSEETFQGFLKKLYDFKEIKKWMKENISYLLSLTNSSVSVIQSNVILFSSLFLTALNTLFQGGYYVINFFLYLLIFVTTLFYLLSTSVDQYIPLKIVSGIVNPVIKDFEIGNTIQNAVNGVFGASIKMFCFYGLFTWVNHSLFGSGIVYIPSILAATFSVMPIIKVYWFCIPSLLELWLLKGSFIRGVGLLAFQVLPTLVVDTSIYGEIETSCHPYLTALAVAGGVYSYGLEGAIFGPLILCFLLVVSDLYSQVMKSCITTEGDESDHGIDEDTFEN